MYLFVNAGLGMSAGKEDAQVAHAAVEAYRASDALARHDLQALAIMNEWYKGNHYAKYVMECRDRDHLLDTERYLQDRGFETRLIIDEGRTEIDAIVPTALGVALVDKDDPHTAATFSSFKLRKQKRPEVYIIETADRLGAERLRAVREACKANDLERANELAQSKRPPHGLPLDGGKPGRLRRRFWFKFWFT